MYFTGGIFSILIFLFVSSIDLKILRQEEKLKFSIKNLKNYYNFLNFIVLTFVNLYLIFLFFDDSILYMLNLLCFLCIYICAFTDIFCKNIFLNVIAIFTIPVTILNIYGNYIGVSILGLIFGMLLYGVIYMTSRYLYGTEVFGIGDIYVISFIGFSTDWNTILHIGLFAFVIAGIFYFIKFIFTKNLENLKNEEIPLVPFILFSYLVIIYF